MHYKWMMTMLTYFFTHDFIYKMKRFRTITEYFNLVRMISSIVMYFENGQIEKLIKHIEGLLITMFKKLMQYS